MNKKNLIRLISFIYMIAPIVEYFYFPVLWVDVVNNNSFFTVYAYMIAYNGLMTFAGVFFLIMGVVIMMPLIIFISTFFKDKPVVLRR